MNNSILKIEPTDQNLIAQVAQIHIDEIPSGFLTTLGLPVLIDMYKTMAQSDGSFVIAVLSKDNNVLGFLAGGTGTHSLYREFLRYRDLGSKFRLAIALLRPSRFFRIVETLVYSNRDNEKNKLPNAEILNFCVAQQGQRQGTGMKLMHAAEKIFRRLGIGKVRIVTGHSQKSAQEFYRKMGVELIGNIEIHRGTPSTMFVWSIDTSKTQLVNGI